MYLTLYGPAKLNIIITGLGILLLLEKLLSSGKFTRGLPVKETDSYHFLAYNLISLLETVHRDPI